MSRRAAAEVAAEVRARPKTAAELDAEDDALFAEMAAKEATIARIIAGGARPLTAQTRHSGPLMVHRDTYAHRVGQWRITRFDEQGEPEGHTEYDSFAAAVKRIEFQGGRLETVEG